MNIHQLCLLLMICICYGFDEQNEEESVVVELELADYDLMDAYDEIAQTSKDFLLNPMSQNTKIQVEKRRGKLLKLQSSTNREMKNIPLDSMRNWTLLTRSGDFLLPEADFNTLIDFANSIQNLSISAGVHKEGYIQGLKSRRNVAALSNLWSGHQNMYSSHSSAYLPVVSLLHKAYPPNDEGSVESYWEMLCEYKDGYRHAARLWKEVEPLYNMLHEFVRIRIQKYYKIADNYTSIPVYLLGSNFGTDWSAIANIILPHPQLYKEIEEALKGQSVEQIFRLAETSTRELRLGSLGKQFWKKSIFNHSNCELHLFSNCAEKYTEAVTCAKVDLSSYMDIHDAAINIALRNQDYSSLARRDLRFSAVDEALQGLGSMIALDNLPANGFVPKDAWTSFGDETERKNAALLLTAIRTLPKLPYYLLSDVTRLHHLDNQQDNFIQGWWSNRKKWQGVQGNSNTEADFLGDHFISLNKPYLSKFLGIFLQFQLLERFSYYEDHENIVNRIKSAKNFRTFIKDRPNRDWAELVDFHYGISEISSDSLLNYFNPLKTYLKEAPFDFIPSDISLTTESETLATDTTNTVSNLEAQNISQPATAPSGLVDVNSKHAGISNSTIWVIVGVVFVAILGVVTFLIVRKVKKRKRRTNNRRFET